MDTMTMDFPLLCCRCSVLERFHHYLSNEKNIIATLFKFSGYNHNHKILPGNIVDPLEQRVL